MLNTKKLLYILPDVAYVAEVLPDKKPHTFSIQSFTQINGEFLDEEQFIAEKVMKLFGKLEENEEYHVILPDFLFTTTIVTVNEKSDAKIAEHLQNVTLPQMGIGHETHTIESAVLNEIRGVSRVQLTAIEKMVLTPIRVAAASANVTIVGLSPLSWALKSMVSLEPSITVLQLGTHLYAAEQYIGVDQTTTSSLDDVGVTIETIKTLKGSEPNIQTVYLLANSVVEERLKTALNKTLPIQQMSSDGDNQDRMPAHIKQIIEYSARTLSIPDYPVPVFDLGKPTKEEAAAFESIIAKAQKAEATETEEEDVESTLPRPVTPVGVAKPAPVLAEKGAEEPQEKTAEANETTEAEEPESKKEEILDEPHKLVLDTTPQKEVAEEDESETAEVSEEEDSKTIDDVEEESPQSAAISIGEKPEVPAAVVAEKTVAAVAAEGGATAAVAAQHATSIVEKAAESVKESRKAETAVASNEDIDLRQFVQAQSKEESLPVAKSEPVVKAQPVVTPKTTIKNKSGVQSMLKMVFITLAVFCLTVGIGVGVGLAFVKFYGSSDTSKTPTTAESTPTPTPTPVVEATPTPTATPVADTKPLNLKVLIANATTKSGYAGTFKTKIEDAKLGTVTAANAKGKYAGGFIIYMKKSDPDIIQRFTETTQLDLTEDKKAAVEDPQGKYDVVIVLAE